MVAAEATFGSMGVADPVPPVDPPPLGVDAVPPAPGNGNGNGKPPGAVEPWGAGVVPPWGAGVVPPWG
jgi:hypothetical protein